MSLSVTSFRVSYTIFFLLLFLLVNFQMFPHMQHTLWYDEARRNSRVMISSIFHQLLSFSFHCVHIWRRRQRHCAVFWFWNIYPRSRTVSQCSAPTTTSTKNTPTHTWSSAAVFGFVPLEPRRTCDVRREIKTAVSFCIRSHIYFQFIFAAPLYSVHFLLMRPSVCLFMHLRLCKIV